MRVFLSVVSVLFVCVAVGCGDKSEKKDDAKKDSSAEKKDSGDKKPVDAKKDDDTDKKDSKVGDTTPPAGDPNSITLTAENTKIEFVGSKDDGKHNGGFKGITGNVQLGTSGPKSMDVTIETNSIWADDEKLTNHLKSDDFFGVDIFPKASLTTSKIEPAIDDDNATHSITADLTMRGVTKSLTIPVKVEQSGGAFKLSGDFEISRKDFGFTYGVDKIHDAVKIHVEVDSSSK
jgi:polyisoprenoid-binding protein YceI